MQQQLLDFLHMLAQQRQQTPQADWSFQSMEELLLTYGRFMPQEPLPDNLCFGTPRACYANSQELAFSGRTLTYVEGYALNSKVSLPTPHAWVLDQQGKAIDPTWSQQNNCYFGIAIDKNWLLNFLGDRVAAGHGSSRAIFTDNHLEGFSLLQSGLPGAAFAELNVLLQSQAYRDFIEGNGQYGS